MNIYKALTPNSERPATTTTKQKLSIQKKRITFLKRHPFDVSSNSRRRIRWRHPVVNALSTPDDLDTKRLAGGVVRARDGTVQLRAECFILASHHRLWSSQHRIRMLGKRIALSVIGMCRVGPNDDTEPEDELLFLSGHSYLEGLSK